MVPSRLALDPWISVCQEQRGEFWYRGSNKKGAERISSKPFVEMETGLAAYDDLT